MIQNKSTIFTLALLLISIMTSLTGCSSNSDDTASGPELDLAQITGCSKIYTTEYEVSKTIFQRDQISVMGFALPGGERVAVIPVRGTVKAYVDLSVLTADDIRQHGDSIEVVLPNPKIELSATQIQAKNVREKVGLFQSNFSDREITKLQQQGRDSLVAEIPHLPIIADARQSTARTLIALLTNMGFDESKIKITFATSESTLRMPKKIKEMIIFSD